MQCVIETDFTIKGTKLTVNGVEIENVKDLNMFFMRSDWNEEPCFEFNYGTETSEDGEKQRIRHSYDPSTASIKESQDTGSVTAADCATFAKM